MEKYSQFRDKGTAIAPFLPVPTPTSSTLWTPVHILLFLVRLPAVLFLSIFYFAFLEHLPIGSLPKKCVLWAILAIPGVWWVDLQVDGVKRGTLASAQHHLPYAGTVLASSFTSPLDPLYLAGIFCPIFTRSYPGYRKVEQISLLRAILLAFAKPQIVPDKPEKLVSLKELREKYPGSIVCVFPECTTTNGRGILPFSPSLLTAEPKTKIFPVNLRYTPGDVTTPVPGTYYSWFWRLLSKPTHVMRVRIAMPQHITPSATEAWTGKTDGESGFDTNIFDNLKLRNKAAEGDEGAMQVDVQDEITETEQRALDRVGEDLARLGRVKRVGLTIGDKIDFVKVWTKRRR